MLKIDAEYKTLRNGIRTGVISTRSPLLSITSDGDSWTITCQRRQWQGTAEELGALNLSIPMSELASQFPGLPGVDDLSESALGIVWSEAGLAASISPVPPWTEGTKEKYPNSASYVYFGQKDGFTRLECEWVSSADTNRTAGSDVAESIVLPPITAEPIQLDVIKWPQQRPAEVTAPAGETVELKGHGYLVNDFALMPDGKLLSASNDGTARLWDISSGEELARFVVPEFVFGSAIVAASSNGERIVSAGGTGFDNCGLRVWDLSTGLDRPNTTSMEKKIREAMMSPDEKKRHIFLYGESSLVGASGRRDYYRVQSLDLSPDGRWAMIVFSDGVGRIYDATTGKIVREVPSTDAGLFTTDGKHLLIGKAVLNVGSWDKADAASEVLAVSSLTDVAGSTGRPIRLPPSSETPSILAKSGPVRLLGHESAITCLDYSEDRRFLVTGGDDATVRIWDADSGRQLHRFRCHPVSVEESDQTKRANMLKRYRVLKVAFLPGGKRVISADAAGSLRIWDMTTDSPDVQPPYQITQPAIELPATGGEIGFDSSGRYLHVGHQVIFDLTTGLMAYQDRNALILSDDLCVAAHLNGIFNVTRSTIVAEFEKVVRGNFPTAIRGDKGVADFDFAHKLCLIGSDEGEIALFDATTGKQIRRFKEHSSGYSHTVYDVQFLPDGKRFVSSSKDDGLLLWNIDSSEPARLVVEDSRARHLIVPHTGNLMAAVYEDIVHVWDMVEKKIVYSLNDVSNAAFSADGRHLVVTHESRRSPEVYDTSTWELVFAARAIPPSAAVAVSFDGKTLAALQNARQSGEKKFSARLQLVHLRSELAGAPTTRELPEPLEFPQLLKPLRRLTADTSSDVAELLKGASNCKPLPDGRHVALDAVDRRIAIFDLQTGEIRCRLGGIGSGELVTNGGVWAHIADGRLTAMQTDGTFARWDLVTGEKLEQLNVGRGGEAEPPLPGGNVQAAAIGDNATWAAVIIEGVSGGVGPYIVDLRRMTRVAKGGKAKTSKRTKGRNLVRPPLPPRPESGSTRKPPLFSHLMTVAIIAGSKGNMLVADESGRVAIIDGSTGQELRQYEGLKNPVIHLAACNKGRSVFAIDSSARRRAGMMAIWDTDSGELQVQETFGGLRADVLPDAATALVAKSNGIVLWDLAKAESLGQVNLSERGPILAAGFMSSGKEIFTLTAEQLQIWQVVK
ncbi:MAG: hypothetical protein O3C40_20940 [Planctomycetota bacterium]|nr:hypothetical protein [Planctomycetota bacterium]